MASEIRQTPTITRDCSSPSFQSWYCCASALRRRPAPPSVWFGYCSGERTGILPIDLWYVLNLTSPLVRYLSFKVNSLFSFFRVLCIFFFCLHYRLDHLLFQAEHWSKMQNNSVSNCDACSTIHYMEAYGALYRQAVGMPQNNWYQGNSPMHNLELSWNICTVPKLLCSLTPVWFCYHLAVWLCRTCWRKRERDQDHRCSMRCALIVRTRRCRRGQ